MGMEGYKTGAIFALIGLVALLMFTTGYFAVSYQEQKDATKSAKEDFVKYRIKSFKKLSNRATSKQVIDLFDQKIAFGKKPQVTTVWDFQGQIVNENDFFAALGITKESIKEEVIDRWFKSGAKRFMQTCNQLYASKNEWSLGYCTLEPYPKEGVS
jgi:hypothetical protein